MSSMLKKKSGFKPKAPIRRNAATPSSHASGPAATADRSSTTPAPPPAPSSAPQEYRRASADPNDTVSISQASVQESAGHNRAPGNPTTGQTNVLQDGKSAGDATRNPANSPGEQVEPQGHARKQDHIDTPNAASASSSTSQPKNRNAIPVASASSSPATGTATPLTPRATLPSVETPEKIDTRVTTRQAATVAARLTAHNQTPSLTPGAERRSTSLTTATQVIALRNQPTQAATPPAESIEGRGSTVEAALETSASTPSSHPAKRASKGKVNEGSTAQPKKRARKPTDNDGEATAASKKRKKKASNTESGGGSAEVDNDDPILEATNNADAEPRRRREDTPEDAEDQTIDVTKVKMAELARDLRIGKKFSLHDQLVRQEKEQRQQYIEARKIKMSGGDSANEGQAEARNEDGTPDPNQESTRASGGARLQSQDDNQLGEGVSAIGPQFQIVDGQIVLDANSLQVDRHARAVEGAGNQEVVEENDFTRKVTSATYLRRKRKPQQWTDEETDKFYYYLNQFGADFEIISHLFPGKDRSNIIGKFRREDKMNPKRITEALLGPRALKVDADEYGRLSGMQLESTEAINAEHQAAQEQFEAEEKRREEELAEEFKKKSEALYGKDGNGQGVEDEEVEGRGSKQAKKSRGRKAAKSRSGGMP